MVLQSGPPPTHPCAGGSMRRRGEVLRRAIFDATLHQLSAVGWRRMTMEGVAACAQTGKAALYRRWQSKEDLVLDALENSLPAVSTPPDGGGLRDELLSLLNRMRTVMASPAGCALRAIMEEMEHEHAAAFHALIHQKVLSPGRQVMFDVIGRGVERGEVRADADIELLADVGPAMMMYRAKTTNGGVTADFPARVVDQALMPMLRP